MRYLKLSLFGMLFFPAGEITAGDNPNKATFAYKPFMQATYAVYHHEEPSRKERLYMVYRLTWDGTVRKPFESYRYQRHALNVGHMGKRGSAIDFGGPFSEYVTAGGVLPRFSQMFRMPVPPAEYRRSVFSDARMREAGSMLGTGTFAEHLFWFPVFDANGTSLQKGQKSQYNAPPFVLLKGTFELLRENKLRPKELPLTTIHSHWKDWKEVDGRRCAVIDFWFEAKADEKLKQGKEDGQVRYEGTSYFSLELGLPVVTVLMGDGFVVDKKGRRETIVLRRKEVLVDYEPYSEEKAQKKRALKAARRKAAEERYRRGDASPDDWPREMIEPDVPERKPLEEKGIEGGKAREPEQDDQEPYR